MNSCGEQGRGIRPTHSIARQPANGAMQLGVRAITERELNPSRVMPPSANRPDLTRPSAYEQGCDPCACTIVQRPDARFIRGIASIMHATCCPAGSRLYAMGTMQSGKKAGWSSMATVEKCFDPTLLRSSSIAQKSQALPKMWPRIDAAAAVPRSLCTNCPR